MASFVTWASGRGPRDTHCTASDGWCASSARALAYALPRLPGSHPLLSPRWQASDAAASGLSAVRPRLYYRLFPPSPSPPVYTRRLPPPTSPLPRLQRRLSILIHTAIAVTVTVAALAARRPPRYRHAILRAVLQCMWHVACSTATATSAIEHFICRVMLVRKYATRIPCQRAASVGFILAMHEICSSPDLLLESVMCQCRVAFRTS